ncbi:MAG: hypothetical protein JXX14_23470, partial [Deltaproteobacteria bacterium]|nr:hypothetical protein [Deltaproteobacteria bacterium]
MFQVKILSAVDELLRKDVASQKVLAKLSRNVIPAKAAVAKVHSRFISAVIPNLIGNPDCAFTGSP